MSSFFDRQFNCLSQPEMDLTWGFLILSLDPLSVGMPKASYEAAWLAFGGVGGERENAYRQTWGLVNVHIEPFDFVVTSEGTWFADYADSIADGDSDPFAPCACNSF